MFALDAEAEEVTWICDEMFLPLEMLLPQEQNQLFGILCLSTDTSAQNTPVKVEVMIQLLYSSKTEKAEALKCTKSKKIKK